VREKRNLIVEKWYFNLLFFFVGDKASVMEERAAVVARTAAT
jgi:hypothetical protein